MGFLSLPESVIEDDDVGPFGVLFGVFGFRHEAVGNVGLLLIFDVVPDFVAFLRTCQAMSPINLLRESKRNFFFSMAPWAAGFTGTEATARKLYRIRYPGHLWR